MKWYLIDTNIYIGGREVYLVRATSLEELRKKLNQNGVPMTNSLNELYEYYDVTPLDDFPTHFYNLSYFE